MLTDQAQRLEALNPAGSYILQAPAGSGKTELLVQRFLKLLATVEHPEEILAITFTRKAANEMRDRVLTALAKTEDKFNILANPNRLRIQTIDSFCAYLNQQMPITSQLGGSISIVENAQLDYEATVNELFKELDQPQQLAHNQLVALKNILLHLDNNMAYLRDLLTDMLAHRDQWLPHIANARQSHTTLRKQLEQTLQNTIQTNLHALDKSFPSQFKQEILDLLQYANYMSEVHYGTALYPVLTELPAHDITAWQTVARFLLTQEYTWRKMVDKRTGFPSESKNKDEQKLYKAQKERMMQLIEQLSTQDSLANLLAQVASLPTPTYTEAQWQVLEDLLELLPILVIKLQHIFQQQNRVDFTELSLRALTALEQDENPTDLALKLDYKIKHILVDEFQDTSITQFRLLELVTAGWQAGDGRTLFLVGDPMQSIYRFRAAEVGLFLQAQQFGVGQIKLTPLTLQTNFRSQQKLVEWFNQVFIEAFPKAEHITKGAIAYSPANAIHPTTTESFLHLHAIDSEQPEHEAATLVASIQTELASNSSSTIAILVRSRSQLHDIIPALKQANIEFQAVEIDPLSHLTVIYDLVALTRALIHFADRTAWLALLRAPWCGLTLNDLHTLSQTDPNSIIWETITTADISLSSDGQARLTHFRAVMAEQLAQRSRILFAQWVKNIWLLLGGPACLTHAQDLQHAEIFFNLLDKLALDTSVDLPRLESELNRLFVSTDHPNARVQLMTIHKAKGLEFDVVMLPSLHQRSQIDAPQILLWQEHPTPDNSLELLLAPIKAKKEDSDAIYNYLQQLEREKQAYEQARLFYVAVTRAKHQLYLFAELPERDPKNNFLQYIWDQHKAEFVTQALAIDTKENVDLSTGNLRRLPSSVIASITKQSRVFMNGLPRSARNDENIPLWQDPLARLLGNVMHRLLQCLSQHPKNKWHAFCTNPQLLKQFLAKEQVAPTNYESALAILGQFADKITHSKQAEWILAPHPDAASELALTLKTAQGSRNIVIDRTFIDNGTRWIIDYKTSQPAAGQSLAEFLEQEKATYLPQLQTYAQAFAHKPEPIKLALYFPMVDELLSF